MNSQDILKLSELINVKQPSSSFVVPAAPDSTIGKSSEFGGAFLPLRTEFATKPNNNVEDPSDGVQETRQHNFSMDESCDESADLLIMGDENDGSARPLPTESDELKVVLVEDFPPPTKGKKSQRNTIIETTKGDTDTLNLAKERGESNGLSGGKSVILS